MNKFILNKFMDFALHLNAKFHVTKIIRNKDCKYIKIVKNMQNKLYKPFLHWYTIFLQILHFVLHAFKIQEKIQNILIF